MSECDNVGRPRGALGGLYWDLDLRKVCTARTRLPNVRKSLRFCNWSNVLRGGAVRIRKSDKKRAR